MTIYTTQVDKNGKTLYYRVTDGKKKNISRTEYEANQPAEVEAITVEQTVIDTALFESASTAEVVETVAATEATREQGEVETVAFDFVKSVIESTGSQYVNKMYLQNSKKCALINYRNCMVCSLVFDKENTVTAIRFMGATIETRKKASMFDFVGLDSLSEYKDAIVKQVEFIDWWYQNPKSKAVRTA
ncbi:hypothetical protein AGMMS49975_21510 [Clostridia bacterium]|nr:hypothetical protein AGMMS49975_21510 [Clostridia bacterium]